MNFELSGKVALITGGSGEIGQSIARELLNSGASVAITGTSSPSVERAVGALSGLGHVVGYLLDVRKTDEISPVVERVRTQLGEIDILVQSAGRMAGKPGLELQADEWDALMDVNTKGLFFVMQQVVRQSMAGIRGMTPPMCAAHYSASKGAVNAITRQAAVEWAELGVRCNAVVPGGVLVGPMAKIGAPPELVAQVPLQSLSHPKDVANGVCFLCSDAARMITGQCLVIDGGVSVVGL